MLTLAEKEKAIPQDDTCEFRQPGSSRRMGHAGMLEAIPGTQQEETQSAHTHLHLLRDQVELGQQVYDTEEARLGKITARFPCYVLVERGWIFHQAYYVPLALVQRVEGQSIWLTVSEATLKEKGFATVPGDLYDAPQSPSVDDIIDISGASRLGKYPLTPAEMGHYHYGPRGPGMNTDASGSYAPYEIDPYGRLRDRPVKLYVTGKRLRPRTL